MKIYHYANSGEYLGEGVAQPDPLDKGEFLIPAQATTIKPPAKQKNKALIFNNDVWTAVVDFRDQEYWLADGTYHKIEELGISKPENALAAKPPPTPEQDWAELRGKRNGLLSQTDFTVLSDYPHMNTEIKQEWLAYRQALRKLPQNTKTDKQGRPINVQWPTPPKTPDLNLMQKEL